MRTLPYLCLNVLLIGASLVLYDRLRRDPQHSAAAPDSALRQRVEELEERLAALSSRVEREVESAATGGLLEARAVDPRLHAAPAARQFSEATLSRWQAGLEKLRTEQLHEDERRYVERRLNELESDWDPREHAAAARIVMDYFRAKAAWFRRIQAERLDPIGAQETYDEIARTHHRKLKEALEDDYKARRVALALMPLRR